MQHRLGLLVILHERGQFLGLLLNPCVLFRGNRSRSWRRQKNALLFRWLISGLSIFQHALKLLSSRARAHPSVQCLLFCHCCRVLVRLSPSLFFPRSSLIMGRHKKAYHLNIYTKRRRVMFGSGYRERAIARKRVVCLEIVLM